MNAVEGFAELFEGRKDAYGTEEGGAFHFSWAGEGDGWEWVAKCHLEGHIPVGTLNSAKALSPQIGVYPMVECIRGLHKTHRPFPTHVVKWGCVDFDVRTKGKPSWDYEDEAEAHVAAVNLQRVLHALGITSWVERTRSNGRHVWVFCTEWTPASWVRRSLLVACGVAGVSTREVNPKQETLGTDQLGNYVRLPYPGGLVENWSQTGHSLARYVIVPESSTVLAVSRFVEKALAHRTPPKVLQALADKWVEPPKPKAITDLVPYEGELDDVTKRLNPAGRSVYVFGPNDGDRSNGLMYLAARCRESGLTPAECMTVLDDTAARWGKFDGRRDRYTQLERIVGKAYV